MAGGSPLRAQTVAVMVNGEPITNYDIEQRGKLNFLTTRKPAVRQDVINELIDEKVKIREGKKFGVDPTSSDIEQSYAAMSFADAHHARAAHQIARKPGHSSRYAEGAYEGRDRLEQPGPRALQGRACRSARRTLPPPPRPAAARSSRPKPLNISCSRSCLIVPKGSAPALDRGTTQGGRSAAQPRADLRGGQRPVQVHAKCHDTRRRDQDFGRHPGRCSAKCSTRPRSAI